MPASSGHLHSALARSVFAALVRDASDGREIDLDGACSAHPDLEAELRSLHANWRRLDGVFDRLSGDGSTDVDRAREDGADRAGTGAETRRLLERFSAADHTRTRYEIIEEIARGGMGVVLRVRDTALERELAMKLVRDAGVEGRRSGWRRLTRFLEEARLTGKLDHPGIVPIHDVGVDAQGRVFFTMPLVRGRRFTEVIDLVHAGRKGWTQARALEAVLKVCDTVAYAHSVGVVHRDLKPDNVMIGRFGETYVMDWGLARVSEHDDKSAKKTGSLARETSRTHEPSASMNLASALRTDDGAVVGTPAYMSPEQASGRGDEVGPQADIYSVGAILYHLLSGKAPYGDELASSSSDAHAPSEHGLLDLVRTGPPTALEKLARRASPELVAIAAKAMARSRSERYADMHSMSEDLRAYMEGRVVQAHEGGALAELKKWVARNKGLSIAIASAVCLALGGLASVSYLQAASRRELLKLSDLRRVDALVQDAETLWPAAPEKAGAMQSWLRDAEVLLENRAVHEKALRELMQRAARSANAKEAPLSAADNEVQWQLENQTRLVAEIARLADPDPRRGLIANVTKRLADAQDLRRASVGEHAGQWITAIESIADVAACPLYRGLRITPQTGLTPIGRDPQSQLWEFAHVASGAPARRTPDGTLAVTPEMGIVLVLIPGGTSTIGSKPPVPGQPSDPFTDSLSQSEEQPPQTVELAPYFLSKFEMSRSQWLRWCAFDPDAKLVEYARGTAVSDLEPIRAISWVEADHALAHMGLELPTEAQWEHAARAGTHTRWWCGNEPRLLQDSANVGSGIDGSLPYADRYEGPAPVNALRPNPWGLHHVHGNVGEWTQDVYWPAHDRKLRAGDGLTLALDSGSKAARGGSFLGSAASARSAARIGIAPDNHEAGIGVRPARALDP